MNDPLVPAFEIPDAVTPIQGWKVFAISNDGLLVSPQQRSKWTPWEPFAAKCRAHSAPYKYVWVNRADYPDEKCMRKDLELRAQALRARRGEILAPQDLQKLLMATAVPPKPLTGDVILIRADTHPHRTPHEGCGCGIHLARHVNQALPYAYGPYRYFALARVNGWGKVIQGTKAHRVEFAYPAKIYSDNHPLIARYGVPMGPLEAAEPDLDPGSREYFRNAARCPSAIPRVGLLGLRPVTSTASAWSTWAGPVGAGPAPPQWTFPSQPSLSLAIETRRRKQWRFFTAWFATTAATFALLAVLRQDVYFALLAIFNAVFAFIYHHMR